MKAKTWIRIAAVFMLLHTIGHTFGTFSGPPNKKIAQIIEDMTQNRFAFMGRSASLAIFFEGYGVVLILFLLLSTLLLWFISTAAETEIGRKLLVLNIFFLTGLTIIEIIYCFPFFLTPLAAVCTIIAFFKINKLNTINT